MLIFKQGNIFEEIEWDYIVNCVNTKGIMGKGLALEFKNRYPEMYSQYRKDCQNTLYTPGCIRTWAIPNSKQYIINFATKDHWKNPSQYFWIEKGLKNLVELRMFMSDTVKIVMPPLGCGNGGLDFTKVRELIVKHLSNTPDRIVVYEPN